MRAITLSINGLAWEVEHRRSGKAAPRYVEAPCRYWEMQREEMIEGEEGVEFPRGCCDCRAEHCACSVNWLFDGEGTLFTLDECSSLQYCNLPVRWTYVDMSIFQGRLTAKTIRSRDVISTGNFGTHATKHC